MVWPRKEAIPGLRLKKDSGDSRKTEAEMFRNGLRVFILFIISVVIV